MSQTNPALLRTTKNTATYSTPGDALVFGLVPDIAVQLQDYDSVVIGERENFAKIRFTIDGVDGHYEVVVVEILWQNRLVTTYRFCTSSVRYKNPVMQNPEIGGGFWWKSAKGWYNYQPTSVLQADIRSVLSFHDIAH